MNFQKFDVLKLSNGKKIVILEKIVYDDITYLYVDDVNDDETDTLDNYYIMRINKNGTFAKEENINTLTKIIPLFNKAVREDYR